MQMRIFAFTITNLNLDNKTFTNDYLNAFDVTNWI